MKQISKELYNIRKENKNFFILEKYENSSKELFLQSYEIIKCHAAKAHIPINEYIEVLHKIIE